MSSLRQSCRARGHCSGGARSAQPSAASEPRTDCPALGASRGLLDNERERFCDPSRCSGAILPLPRFDQRSGKQPPGCSNVSGPHAGRTKRELMGADGGPVEVRRTEARQFAELGDSPSTPTS